jgi:hypothetical protein
MFDATGTGLYPYDNVAIPAHAVFHSVDDLSNASTLTQFPLGDPRFRFGYRTDTGRPREFDSGGIYFGRFTHEETSDVDFKYPHDYGALGDPHAITLNLNTTTNVFPNYTGGLRRGEDLLLSNVHSFDVKIWDPGALGGAGAFANIGQSLGTQDPQSPNAVNYRVSGPDNRSNIQHGPVNPSSAFAAPYNVNRVFDTWYPFVRGVINPPTPDLKIDLDSDDRNDPPPFRHVIYGAGTPNNFNEWGVAVGKAPNLATRQQPVWEASTAYAEGDLRFPVQVEALPLQRQQRNNGLRFVYRCVTAGTSAPADASQPSVSTWPAVAGARFTDGTVVWEAVENWRPLRAIQITIRFHDVTSDQIRQQTIVHALAD